MLTYKMLMGIYLILVIQLELILHHSSFPSPLDTHLSMFQYVNHNSFRTGSTVLCDYKVLNLLNTSCRS